MTKNILILIVVASLVLFLWDRGVLMSRIQKIDWLNANVSNGSGNWVKMTDDELTQVYKPFALIKKGAKPDASEWLKVLDILKKYQINDALMISSIKNG